MERQHHRWHSERLGRDMDLLVFGSRGMRVLVFPTRAGRFYDYENWGLVAAMAPAIENGWMQLYCVDSVDAESFYCCWCRPEDRLVRHEQYEAYLLQEVVPLSEQLNPHSVLATHGNSFGAYHAVNLAFRHPHLFRKVVALSGRYDLTRSVGGFRDLFDGHYDERVYFHNPSHYVPNLDDPSLLERLRGLEITLGIGAEDVFLENNLQLSETLHRKGVAHRLHVWDGEAHRPRYWRQMVPMYL